MAWGRGRARKGRTGARRGGLRGEGEGSEGRDQGSKEGGVGGFRSEEAATGKGGMQGLDGERCRTRGLGRETRRGRARERVGPRGPWERRGGWDILRYMLTATLQVFTWLVGCFIGWLVGWLVSEFAVEL